LARQPGKTERILQQIMDYMEQQPDRPDVGEILDLVAADRASYAAVQGDVHEAIRLAGQILERLPFENAPMRMRLSSTLGLAHQRAGDLDRAEQAFGEAIAAARTLGMDFAAVPLVCNQAEIQFLRGQLCQAAETCARAVRLGTVGGTPHSVTGYAEIEQAKILYEQNDLESAAGRVEEGIERLAQGGSPDSFGNAHTVLARIQQAQGNTQGALEAIETAILAAQDSRIPRAIHLTRAYRARIWLAQGRLAQAVRWADEYRMVGETAYLREAEDLTLIRVLLAQDQTAKALSLLDDLLVPTEEAGRFGHVLEIEALRTLALEALGDRDQALEALAHALHLAAPEGYVRVFVEEGRPMGELLLALSRMPSQVDTGYVRTLLAALSGASEDDPGLAFAPDRQPLFEPLTERELEVLRLLAEGMTNPEIGERLYISRPTVKTHVRNIFGKLDVHNRRDAVEQARALRILPNI
jgi:LuxR family maltose regulon positive regulatory protein